MLRRKGGFVEVRALETRMYTPSCLLLQQPEGPTLSSPDLWIPKSQRVSIFLISSPSLPSLSQTSQEPY